MTQKKAALHKLADYSAEQIATLLSRVEDDLSPYMAQVQPVIDQVRRDRDDALIALAERFDKADMTGKALLATTAEIDAAFDRLDPALIDALGYAADNIRRFHECQKPEDPLPFCSLGCSLLAPCPVTKANGPNHHKNFSNWSTQGLKKPEQRTAWSPQTISSESHISRPMNLSRMLR